MNIIFTKSFANKKKGDVESYDGQLAASLIKRGFAKLKKSKKK